MHKRKLSALGKCPLSKIWVPAHALVLACGREMLRQKSRIYSAESFNSRQSEPFAIKWLTCIFCITVNIAFNIGAQVA